MAEVRAEISANVWQVTAEVGQRMEAQMAAAVNTAVDTAVTRAVAETRKQDDQRTAALLSATERRRTGPVARLALSVAQRRSIRA